MGRGKGHYNKERERVRQQLEQLRGKYRSDTAIYLRENLTRKITESEMEKDFINIFENHHNVCKCTFIRKKSLNHYEDYKYYKNKNQPSVT